MLVVVSLIALAIWLDAFDWSLLLGVPLGIWVSVKMSAEEKRPILHGSGGLAKPS